MRSAFFALAVLQCRPSGGQIDVVGTDFLPLQSAFTDKSDQGMPTLHMDDVHPTPTRCSQPSSRATSASAVSSQITVARKPHRLEAPKPLRRKTSNALQRIVFTPMRVAAQVLQFPELTKNRASSRVSHRRLHFIDRGDPMFREKLDQGSVKDIVTCS